jgi:hypothetical protein
VTFLREVGNLPEREGSGVNMSRGTWLNLFLIIVAALLAIGLFVAGAMWKGRVSRDQRLTPTELSR